MARDKGFTIIELLVVIAIFLAMIAALTPFVRMTRQRVHRINCANNLRRISLGLHRYAADNNEAFPPNLGALYPNYVEDEKAFDCPASKTMGTPANPDYTYSAGFTESSGAKEIIAQDFNNHKKFKKNVLRLDGSVDWVNAR